MIRLNLETMIKKKNTRRQLSQNEGSSAWRTQRFQQAVPTGLTSYFNEGMSGKGRIGMAGLEVSFLGWKMTQLGRRLFKLRT